MTVSRSGRWLLRLYPPSWRERYGEELLSLIDSDSDGRSIPWRIRLDVARAGLGQRLRSSGLVGDDLPPQARVRAGLLLVLCSWSAFVVAGIGLQKTSEQWRAATPRPGQALPAAAFDSVLVAAALGSAAVLLGIALATRPLLAFLRRGGWRQIRRPVLRALGVSVVTAVLLAAVATWAHQLTGARRNGGDPLYAGAFLLLAACCVGSIAAWTTAAVTTARHLALSAHTLRVQTVLAAAITLAMAAMTVATATWWISIARAAPAFLGAGVPWRMLVLALTMLAATGLAAAGTARSIRATSGTAGA